MSPPPVAGSSAQAYSRRPDCPSADVRCASSWWMLLYNSAVSGNCYKVRLLAAHLGLPLELQELSVVDRSNRAEVLGDLNPARRVPTLVLDDGRPLAESNAILWYLGDGTRLRSRRPLRARAGAAVAVLRAVPGRAVDRRRPVPDRLLGRGGEARRPHQGADRQRLRRARRDGAPSRRAATFLVGERYTIADISLYAYTHVAHEGGFDLERYAAIRPGSTGSRASPATSRSTREA